MNYFLAVYLFYIGFAVSISVYRQWLKGTLNLLNKVLFAPILLGFATLDVALNFTVFLLLMGPPPTQCYTISARLAWYHQYCTDWRHSVAVFVCDELLNPIDPAGGHC